jgi:hypothetical protein
MSLLDLKSIFEEDTRAKAEDFDFYRPKHSNDSRIIEIGGTHQETPILDTIGRGWIYTHTTPPVIAGRKLFVLNNEDANGTHPFQSDNFVTSTADVGTIHKAEVSENFSEEGNISDKGWSALYHADHKPRGGVGISYSSNVNRDKLDIRNNESRTGLLTWSRTPLLGLMAEGLETLVGKDDIFNEAGEPYIVSRIPKGPMDITSGRLTQMGDRSVPIARSTVDTVRLAKFFTSPAGIAFIAKQNVLGLNTKVQFVDADGKKKEGSQRFGRLYNPISTITAVSPLARNLGSAVPNVLIGRQEPDLSTLGIDVFEDTTYSKSVEASRLEDTFSGASDDETAGTFSGLGKAATDAINSAVNTAMGTTTVLKGKSDGGDFMTLKGFGFEDTEKTTEFKRPQYKSTLSDAYGEKTSQEIESQKNGMPFYFKDLRDNAHVFFRAYLDGISENIAPSWTSTNYIGRSEPVYTYERAERDLSFTLKLFAHTREELKMIYKKMNRLTSMCYPEYATDALLSDSSHQKIKMKPPLTKFRMGELFGKTKEELLGFLKSVSYSVPAEATWETENGARVPKYVTTSITYQVIHASAPNLNTNFYGYVGGD